MAELWNYRNVQHERYIIYNLYTLALSCVLTVSVMRFPPIAYTNNCTMTAKLYTMYNSVLMPFAIIKLIDAKQITNAVDKKVIRIIAVQMRTKSSCILKTSVCFLIICLRRRSIRLFSVSVNRRFWSMGAGKTQTLPNSSYANRIEKEQLAAAETANYRFLVLRDCQFRASIWDIGPTNVGWKWETVHRCRRWPCRYCCRPATQSNRSGNSFRCRHRKGSCKMQMITISNDSDKRNTRRFHHEPMYSRGFEGQLAYKRLTNQISIAICHNWS